MTRAKFLQAHQVTLTLVEQCCVQAGNEELRLICRSKLDSLDCPKLPVPSLSACAKAIKAEDTVDRLAHNLSYDSSLPITFREIVKVVLHEDCTQTQVAGRLVVVFLFTSRVVLACLRNGCDAYVLPISINLATVISDCKAYDDIVYVLNSRFGGILDTPTSHACFSLPFIMWVTLGLILWYFSQ